MINEQRSIDRRIILVTGANKGLGYAIVSGLLKEDTNQTNVIILTSRNVELGQNAIQKLLEATSAKKEQLDYHQLDVCDNKSISGLKDWVKEKYGKLDVLINNAGYSHIRDYYDPEYILPDDEYKKTRDTNYLGVRQLTYELLPFLSKDGKIINMSSRLSGLEIQSEATARALSRPDLSEKDMDDMLSAYNESVIKQNLKEVGFTWSPYCFLKAMLNFWTHKILAEKLEGDQQAYVMSPGWCRTDMGGEDAPRSPEEGADTAIYLAGLPFKRDEHLNCKFFQDRTVRNW